MVIIAYTMFMVGCAIVGVGQTMWQVVLGRIVSGAGASGMSALVSVLITGEQALGADRYCVPNQD